MNYELFSEETAPTSLVCRDPQPDKWVTDPARLTFSEYMDRCKWAEPDFTGTRRCIDRALVADAFWYEVSVRDNEYKNGEDLRFGAWETAVECGRSYLVGDSQTTSEFLRRHTSTLTRWQRIAYAWCIANPQKCLVLNSRPLKRIYHIKKRGEYVEFGLPHQDHGGERHWICRDGKRKVLINVD
jgi:hypothetical protein